jgi:hypothetical protein
MNIKIKNLFKIKLQPKQCMHMWINELKKKLQNEVVPLVSAYLLQYFSQNLLETPFEKIPVSSTWHSW